RPGRGMGRRFGNGRRTVGTGSTAEVGRRPVFYEQAGWLQVSILRLARSTSAFRSARLLRKRRQGPGLGVNKAASNTGILRTIFCHWTGAPIGLLARTAGPYHASNDVRPRFRPLRTGRMAESI